MRSRDETPQLRFLSFLRAPPAMLRLGTPCQRDGNVHYGQSQSASAASRAVVASAFSQLAFSQQKLWVTTLSQETWKFRIEINLFVCISLQESPCGDVIVALLIFGAIMLV